MASESGVLPMPESKIVSKWRLQPGKMFLIDLEQGRMIDDEELKATSPQPSPTSSGSRTCASASTTWPSINAAAGGAVGIAARPQQAFGTTQEDIKFLLAPMAQR
jgi:glutamate synthase (NADPH/NADH) large chain